MSEPNTKMEDLINETQSLIDTLEILNNEIESYQVAKNNLVDVKNKLEVFTGQFTQISNSIYENIIEMNQSFRSEVKTRIENISSAMEKDKVYFDQKVKLLTGIAIFNTLALIAAVILIVAK